VYFKALDDFCVIPRASVITIGNDSQKVAFICHTILQPRSYIMAGPERDNVYTNTNTERSVYTRDNNATGWFVGIIVVLALLAIGYLVFSANSGTTTPANNVNNTPVIETPAAPATNPAPMTEAPAAPSASPAPSTQAPANNSTPPANTAPATPAAPAAPSTPAPATTP
jgi:cytoskeletal protein RodZ